MECFGLNCFAWIAIVILTLCLLFRQFKKKIFAFLLARTSKNPILDKHKKKLFSPLNEAAQKAGNRKLKVLEIGGGSGCNFPFVEIPVNWTVTEPNLCFESYFLENCKDWKDKHQIGQLVEAYGEDLGKFETGSFDAVIITLVLCSVTGVQETLREIRRVLKPGGTFYFLEHVRAPTSDRCRRFFHDYMTEYGIWPAMCDGCCLNRETKSEVEQSGFSKVEIVDFIVSSENWIFNMINPVPYAIYGWATK